MLQITGVSLAGMVPEMGNRQRKPMDKGWDEVLRLLWVERKVCHMRRFGTVDRAVAQLGWHSWGWGRPGIRLKPLPFWLLHHIVCLRPAGGVGIGGVSRHGPALVLHLIGLGQIGGNLGFPLRGRGLATGGATTGQNQRADGAQGGEGVFHSIDFNPDTGGWFRLGRWNHTGGGAARDRDGGLANLCAEQGQGRVAQRQKLGFQLFGEGYNPVFGGILTLLRPGTGALRGGLERAHPATAPGGAGVPACGLRRRLAATSF